MERQIEDIDEKLFERTESTRKLLETAEGQLLLDDSIALVECFPWVAKTVASWTPKEVKVLLDQVAGVRVEPDDPIKKVSGYQSPPSDLLVSMVAAKAGLPTFLLSNAVRQAVSTIPFVGSSVKGRLSEAEEMLNDLTVDGAATPCSDSDWKIVFRALKQAQAVHNFQTSVWDVQSSRNK